jgi:hypothetical protein
MLRENFAADGRKDLQDSWKLTQIRKDQMLKEEYNAMEVEIIASAKRIGSLNAKIRNLEAEVIDKENHVRNLKAGITAKVRIILEKMEENNKIWEKVKALERNEEKVMSPNADMEIDNEVRKKKKKIR